MAFYCNPIVQDLIIDHTDATANTLQVLEQLLEQNRVQWSARSRYSRVKILNWGHNRYQQLEGTLNELCEHNLPAGETKEQLLNERGNSVAFWQVEPFG